MPVLQEVIKHKKDGWYLYSKDGKKKLGGPYTSRQGAVSREKQVNYFKNKESVKREGTNLMDQKILAMITPDLLKAEVPKVVESLQKEALVPLETKLEEAQDNLKKVTEERDTAILKIEEQAKKDKALETREAIKKELGALVTEAKLTDTVVTEVRRNRAVENAIRTEEADRTAYLKECIADWQDIAKATSGQESISASEAAGGEVGDNVDPNTTVTEAKSTLKDADIVNLFSNK